LTAENRGQPKLQLIFRDPIIQTMSILGWALGAMELVSSGYPAGRVFHYGVNKKGQHYC